MSRYPLSRKPPVVAIAVGVGLLHFLTGPEYSGPFPAFVNGYMIDIVLPFALYLVLGVTNYPALRSKIARCALVFGIGAATETLQYLGVPIFGRTFDPLDYLMFCLGTCAAAIFEWGVLSKIPGKSPTQPSNCA